MTTHKDYLDYKRQQVVIAPRFEADHGITGEVLSADVEAFLAAGGQIQSIEPGVMTTAQRDTREASERKMEWGKGRDGLGRPKGHQHETRVREWTLAKDKGER